MNSEIQHIQLENENYYKIPNNDKLRPFFMSIVSDSNHWMFISSNGGLTAGRKNSQYALFPYYTDDKINESADITGSKTIFQVQNKNGKHLWEPFSECYSETYNLSRNLYKNAYGNKVLFEEINHDLGLTFRYQWNSSNQFGFVKKSKLINHSQKDVKVSLIDGVQNIVPYGVNSDLQNRASNLVDAYKRSELIKSSGLGIYALSAIIVDKAEPSEALKANVVWSLGLENATHLLSSLQLKNFRKGSDVKEELDVKAEKGAYFINKTITLSANQEKEWLIVANVNQNHAAIAKLSNEIHLNSEIKQQVLNDIELGTENLIALTAASDGLQLTKDNLRDTRHFSNTLFNIMRGGIFDDNYFIEKWDFKNYLENANTIVFTNNKSSIDSLPDVFPLTALRALESKSKDSDFRRLCLEYMPLKFSRRHGDPSRPWNQFSINTRSEVDGSKILDYEGNWRDIFQNWEALAHSYPMFMESMIHKFLNATTFDGYNPYRVTKGGFDWETIEPDDPWSYIGYWGDHQIIYLLKFLEFIQNHYPGKLDKYFREDLFVYANVPYIIKSYQDILKNPKDTIDFNHESDEIIREKREKLGADGALLENQNNEIYKVNFIEKILATVLAKISNFIPEGGIWMNTQRPEWNDANNALVGNGVSMVTLYYLRRFLKFLEDLLNTSSAEKFQISEELETFYSTVSDTLIKHQNLLGGTINDIDRKKVLDGLGEAGSAYRFSIYEESFSGKKQTITLDSLKTFVNTSLKYLEHSIEANKREDNLYHAYNLMTVKDNGVSISYLDEMLEGQVAVLSSGYLSAKESISVLDALKSSSLFREDQYSYILYPNKDLPLFQEKNSIPKDKVNSSKLLKDLVASGNTQIVEKDVNGDYHFNGNFRNANDVKEALKSLGESKFAVIAKNEEQKILQIFEDIFNHKAFTGRSGTFFGYEGLGSIYWHMVSKLQLAVYETCIAAIENNESPEIVGKLLEHYYEINEGIGVHKSPELYGAFPTDPYSHTPAGKGAQQPGMTGQVKEDVLSRFGELGVFVKEGSLYFNPSMLRKDEFLDNAQTFNYVDINSDKKQIEIEANAIAFTYCQVPIVYKLSNENSLTIIYKDNRVEEIESLTLDKSISNKIFERSGDVVQIIANVKESILK